MDASEDKATLIVELLAEAERQINGGALETAMQMLSGLVTEVPDCHQGWYLLGKLALQSGDRDSAMTMLAHASQLAPQQAEYLAALDEATTQAQQPALVLLPAMTIYGDELREICQQAILYCVFANRHRWWNRAALQAIFLCEPPAKLRRLLRLTLPDDRDGDASVFLRLSARLDRLGVPAEAPDQEMADRLRRRFEYPMDAIAESGDYLPADLGAMSPRAMMNGLLALHTAETHVLAQRRFGALRACALDIWQSGHDSLTPETDVDILRQIARMLWHFDLLAEARESLLRGSPGHFLIGIIEKWQRSRAANAAWAADFRKNVGAETHVHIVGATVWGDEYLDFFLGCHLPSLLAPGNLPHLASAGRLILSIVTDARGRQIIEDAPIASTLKAVAELRFTATNTLPQRGDAERARLFYMHYGLLDHHHVMLAHDLAANLVLLPVDTVISAHGLRVLHEGMGDNHDCCTIAGIEAYKSAVLPALHAECKANVLSISAADLAALAMAHPTRYFRSLQVSPQHQLNAHPREFFWRTADGYVCHSLFMHPVMLSARVLKEQFHPNHENTDWALIPRLLQGSDRVRVIDDAGQLFILHCSEDNARAQEYADFTGVMSPELGEYLLSVHRHDYPVHRQLFRQPMRFPAQDNEPPGNYHGDIQALFAWFRTS